MKENQIYIFKFNSFKSPTNKTSETIGSKIKKLQFHKIML